MPNYKDQACAKSVAKNSQLIAKKKGFFDSIAKIGKLEFLNDFGMAGGGVRLGLEQLAVISDTVRVGGVTTETIGDIYPELTEDGQGLMRSMGLDTKVQGTIAQFDPGAVNGAVGAAKGLIARARQGNFRVEDIATAAGEFKNIALIANKIFKPATDATSKGFQRFQCRPSPYAMDLVHKAPKQNFQFIVEIELHPAYKQQFLLGTQNVTEKAEARTKYLKETKSDTALRTGVSENNSGLAGQLAFLVKTSGRPAPSYEYEDLNYYNYRTKGIRKTTYQPVNMTFLDDQLNMAAAFYAFYSSAMSPIVNMGIDPKDAVSKKNYEQSGMNFEDFHRKQEISNGSPNSYPAYASSIGALRPTKGHESNNTKSIIQRISIFQFGKNANSLTAYNMFNPRILSFAPSEVTMSDSGDGQSLGMEIDYDYFTIHPEIDIGTDDMSKDRLAGLTGGDAGAAFPIRHFPNSEQAGAPDKESLLSATGSKIKGFFAGSGSGDISAAENSNAGDDVVLSAVQKSNAEKILGSNTTSSGNRSLRTTNIPNDA